MEVFPSTLIISSDKNKIVLKIQEICTLLKSNFDPNNPDINIIDKSSGWGIDQIRLLKKFISQKPFNHQSKIVIIFDADKLNSESQNALLKTLEEPGENNYIILTTSKSSNLLPTIVSRCHTLKIFYKSKTDQNNIVRPTGNLSTDLLTSETLSKNKEEVLPFFENQLKLYQKLLITNHSLEVNQNIEKIIKAIRMINANVDPKSALDFFFLA